MGILHGVMKHVVLKRNEYEGVSHGHGGLEGWV